MEISETPTKIINENHIFVTFNENTECAVWMKMLIYPWKMEIYMIEENNTQKCDKHLHERVTGKTQNFHKILCTKLSSERSKRNSNK